MLLSRFTVFKVKLVKGAGVVITHGSLNFFIKRGNNGLRVGDSLQFLGNLLIPKQQPLWI